MLHGNRGQFGQANPSQPGAFPWTVIHGYGTIAQRPVAAPTNAGYLYLATNVNGGTLYRSNGTSWDTIGAADHGALTGLSDDDHSIYALLAGRSGGQTLYGGTSSGENMTIRSTSSTNGTLTLQNNGGSVAIGGGANATQLVLKEPSGSGTNHTGFVAPALSADVVYVLPTADGSSGQVLTTDGNATLSWTSTGEGVKFWAYVTVSSGTPTLQANHNVTSITDTNVGRLTVTIATDFASANWCCQVSVERGGGNPRISMIREGTQAAGSIEVNATNVSGAANDPDAWHVTGFGAQ